MNENFSQAIDDILKFMMEKSPDSDEYGKAVHNLKAICEAAEKIKEDPPPVEEDRKLINPQVLQILSIIVPAFTAIIQIGMIIGHEQLNVITTKAIGFVMKGRS